MLLKIRDYLAAHAKGIIGIATVMTVQLEPNGELDWIVTVIGLALLLIVPNDEAARDRIYPNRRR